MFSDIDGLDLFSELKFLKEVLQINENWQCGWFILAIFGAFNYHYPNVIFSVLSAFDS